MSDTTVASGNEVSQWADDEFLEWTRDNPFRFLMGTDPTKPIHIKEELTDSPGRTITVSLLGRLDGDGVADGGTLMGSEEALNNYAQSVTVHQLRNGVVVGKYESIKTKIDLWKAAKGALKIWEMSKLRDQCLDRMLSPNTDGLTTYAASTEAQKDAWEVANNPATNNGRILFGAAISNGSGDHSAGLSNIDGTADDLHPDIVRLLKRRLQTADPHVQPAQVAGGQDVVGGERWYGLTGSFAFRDLQANMDTIFQNADVRGEDNQIFAGGSIKIGNCVIFEVPEMDRLSSVGGGCLLDNVGNGSIDVGPLFLMGAQALVLAWKQRLQIHMDEFDYQDRRGVAIDEIRGTIKSTYNSFMHGMGTAYVSAVGD